MKNGAWATVRIGDLGTVITGRTPSSSRPECFGDKYPFITPVDMHDRRLATTTERYLSDEGATVLKRNLLPANSVAVSCIGWQMGKSILTARPSFTNQQLNAVIPNERVDPAFLYYHLTTRRTGLFSLGSATGVRTPILNKSAFSNLTLELPPLATQQKIAGVLGAYDELIENNRRRIEILEEMARRLYREWFVQFRFPGHARVPLTDSPLGKIPKGWEPHSLGELAVQERRGIQPDKIAPGTPYFGLEHLPRRSIALGEWGTADEVQSTKFVFHRGEILFGKIRPYFHKVGVAPVEGVCSSDAIVIRPTKDESFGPVLCCVSSDEFVEHATKTSNGTKMPRANWDVLVKYPLVLPPCALRERFNAAIRDTVDSMHNLIFRTRNLHKTRDLLLPRLISGELDVSELPIEVEETPRDGE